MAITINGNGTITGISVGGLPDGIVDTDMIAANAVTNAKSSGLSGLTMADTWRLTASFQSQNTDPEYLTTNWERDDTNGFGQLGTGMTESGGYFSFPSTGIYYMNFIGTFSTSGSGGDNYTLYIYTTTDNSNYNQRTRTLLGMDGNNNRPSSGSTACLFDVTNTSTHKVRFAVGSVASGSLAKGDTNANETHVTFMKLGET